MTGLPECRREAVTAPPIRCPGVDQRAGHDTYGSEWLMEWTYRCETIKASGPSHPRLGQVGGRRRDVHHRSPQVCPTYNEAVGGLNNPAHASSPSTATTITQTDMEFYLSSSMLHPSATVQAGRTCFAIHAAGGTLAPQVPAAESHGRRAVDDE